MSKLSGEAAVNPEPTPEPAPEPVSEAEPTPEPTEVQPQETPEADNSSEAESQPEEATDKSPLESLSEDVDDWTPKAANRFKQLKGELKSSRTELEGLQQTVKEQDLKIKEMTGLVENRDIDQLQEAVANYEYDRAFEELEDTAAYKQAVTEPLSELVEYANQIASHYDVSEDVIIDILGMEETESQDKALQEYFAEASDRDKAALYQVINAIDPVLERRQQLYDNVEAALNEASVLEEQRKNQEAADKDKFRVDVTRNVVERVSEKLPFLSGVEGLDMASIEAKAAETDPSVVHPVDFAYNAVAAQLLPTIVREYLTARKENGVLTDKLAEYEDAEPTMSGVPASEGGSTVAKDMSFTDAVNAAFAGG